MNKITHITPHFAVTGALQPADFAASRRSWASSRCVSNLPDGKSAGLPHQRAGSAAGRRRRPRLSPHPATKVDVFSRPRGRMAQRGAERARRARCWRIAPRACARQWPGRRGGALPIGRLRARGAAAAGFNLEALRDELGEACAIPAHQPVRRRSSVGYAERAANSSEQPRISRRRRGSSSVSNHGLAVSQALLRQEGCGSGMRRGRASASSSSRQRLTVVRHAAARRGAQVPALGVAADGQDQLELRHGREQALVPGGRAFPARRQVAAGRVVAGKAEAHGHDGDAALVVELLGRELQPGPQAVAGGSVKGVPEACTRTPGAWLQMQMRAVALGRSTGRGSCGSGRRAAHRGRCGRRRSRPRGARARGCLASTFATR